MTTNAKKTPIYWGLFASPHLLLDGELSDGPRYYEKMAVTSFSIRDSGRYSKPTKMVHGSTVGVTPARSIHRRVDGMRFYTTQEAMEKAYLRGRAHDLQAQITVRQAMLNLQTIQKNLRLAHEGLLNQHEVQPTELSSD